MTEWSNLRAFAFAIQQAKAGGVRDGFDQSVQDVDAAFAAWLEREHVPGWLESFPSAQRGPIRDAYLKAWADWYARAAILKPLLAANSNEVTERKAQ